MSFAKRAFVFLILTTVYSKPVVRKMNFNLFMLKPKNGNAISETEYVKSPVKALISTNGISRFPPLLEYVVQRVQGLLSVRVPDNHLTPPLPPEDFTTESAEVVNVTPDSDENELQDEDQVGLIHGVDSATGLSNVIVKPSAVHPGTYEVEISVAVDDGKPIQPANVE